MGTMLTVKACSQLYCLFIYIYVSNYEKKCLNQNYLNLDGSSALGFFWRGKIAELHKADLHISGNFEMSTSRLIIESIRYGFI